MRSIQKVLKRKRSQVLTAMSPAPGRREMGKDDPSLDPVREFGAWLLWAGLSPESKQPVSRIGIYTDFT